MSKETERLNFNWQRSNNQYMVLLTIIIGSFSFLSIMPDRYKIYLFWLLAISITLFGFSIINLNADELVYEFKGLRDKREKVTKFKKYTRLVVYLFIAFTGLMIMLFGSFMILILTKVLPNPFI